jgi:hypothetical protein
MPFNIYKLFYSHNCINHVARGQMCVSVTVRVGCSMSNNGVRSPILALKSPHITVCSWGCICSITPSTCAMACVSVMSLRASDDVGGKYTFAMEMRSLVGKMSLVIMAYSLPYVCSSLRDWR